MMKVTYPSYNQFDNVILSNACYMYMCSHLKGEVPNVESEIEEKEEEQQMKGHVLCNVLYVLNMCRRFNCNWGSL